MTQSFNFEDPEVQNLIKIVSNPKLFEKILQKASQADREYLLSFASDLNNYIEANPILKFRKNNVPQQKFLGFTKPFQIFIGGNKGGKTATISKKAVDIALGMLPAFNRKPAVGKPLINWLCGETRDVLEQTPLEELTKWLRADQYKVIRRGSIIDRVRIFVDPHDERIYSDFIFKPYSGGVDIFESANVSGVIVCDEEMPKIIFDAIIPRMVAHGAWLFNALTPTHGVTYMNDVLLGKGEYSGLTGAGLIEWVEASTKDNLQNLDPNLYIAMLARFAVHNDRGKMLAEDGSIIDDPYVLLEPDCKVKPKLTAMGKVRLEGKFTAIDGRVYQIQRSIGEDSWHQADLKEMPPLEKCKIFALSDYGRADDFVFCLVAVDEDDTHWFFAEVYQNNLETHEQALAIYELCEEWGVRPIVTVADSQINDRGTKGGTILDDYITATFPEGYKDEKKQGQVILGRQFTDWLAKPEYKKNPPIARQSIGQKLDVNPKTKKPFYRFIASQVPRLFTCLEYAEYKKDDPTKMKNKDDHGEAALRYYNRADIKWNHWQTSEELENYKTAVLKYRKAAVYKGW